MTMDEHESRLEALEYLRPLVLAEEDRSTNLNGRALGIISGSAVVTAIAALFAKDVLDEEALKHLGSAEGFAIVLLTMAVGLLGLTVILGVRTLWPKERLAIEPHNINQWKFLGNTEPGEKIRLEALKDHADLLLDLRAFNAKKVKRLKRAYTFYALAVLAIAVDAGVFFCASL